MFLPCSIKNAVAHMLDKEPPGVFDQDKVGELEHFSSGCAINSAPAAVAVVESPADSVGAAAGSSAAAAAASTHFAPGPKLNPHTKWVMQPHAS